MLLVNECHAVISDDIIVWSIGSSRHQNDCGATIGRKIHSPLEAHAFALAHFVVGNDFVRHRDSAEIVFVPSEDTANERITFGNIPPVSQDITHQLFSSLVRK
jgi:hypothetical protein